MMTIMDDGYMALSLFFRYWLGAVDVFVFRRLRWADALEEVSRCSDVVSASVREIDDSLAVVIHSHDSADNACEALQLRPLRLDGHVLIHPFAPQFINFGESVHRAAKPRECLRA